MWLVFTTVYVKINCIIHLKYVHFTYRSYTLMQKKEATTRILRLLNGEWIIQMQ